MNPSDISKILHSLNINPDEISEKKESQTIRILLHIIEELNEEVQALKAELQKTRDELNQLKGEKGKPKFSVPKRTKTSPPKMKEELLFHALKGNQRKN